MTTKNGTERRRVVITGLGMVSSLGLSVDASWKALLAGESGVNEITLFDTSDYPVHFACELKDFDPTVWIDRKASRRMDRFAQIVLAAARQAHEDSGLDIAANALTRVFWWSDAAMRRMGTASAWLPTALIRSGEPTRSSVGLAT